MSFRTLAHGLLGATTRCLGEPVVYVAQGYAAVTIQAVYDALFQEFDPNTSAVVVSEKPSISIRDADLPAAPRQDDTLTVFGLGFKVLEVQPDGQGGSRLLLHKA